MSRTVASMLALCGACSAPPPGAPVAPRGEQPAREAPSDAPCSEVGATERLEIEAGSWFTSATGLWIRFEGASHDSFEGGGTDLSLELALWVQGERSERWMPSALAPPRWTPILGHCVRIAEASSTRAIFEVALPRAGAAELRSCAEGSTPRLEDYALVADGRRYFVDVTRDPSTGEWQPTPLPRMPHHHASRLSLRGLTDYPGLLTLGDERPRFVIELLSHTIEQVPGRHEWRAEYVARVVEVCVPRAR